MEHQSSCYFWPECSSVTHPSFGLDSVHLFQALGGGGGVKAYRMLLIGSRDVEVRLRGFHQPTVTSDIRVPKKTYKIQENIYFKVPNVAFSDNFSVQV